MNGEYNGTVKHVNAAFSGNETIRQLARRHLTDKSHTTTDEELRNAKIELSNISGVNKINLYAIESFTIINSK